MRMFCSVTSVVLAVLLGGGTLSALRAKPSGVLASLTFTVPAQVRTGDEVTTTLRFMALQDIEQLRVSVREGPGLMILSQPYEVAFLNLRTGMAREFEVRVRMTGEKRGELVVTYTTRSSAFGRAGDVKAIEYGAPR